MYQSPRDEQQNLEQRSTGPGQYRQEDPLQGSQPARGEVQRYEPTPPPQVGPGGDRSAGYAFPAHPQHGYGQPQYAQTGPPLAGYASAGYAYPGPVQPPLPARSMGLAYVLWFFLGAFGAHDFYLGKTGLGIGRVMMTVSFWLTVWFLLGFLILIVAVIWHLVEACLIPGWTQEANQRSQLG